MRCDCLRAFSFELGRPASVYLVAPGVAPAEVYRLEVEECPAHGPGRLRVT